VQQRWGKIKKLTTRGYLALIKWHKTPPSPATLAAVEEDKGEPTQTIDDDEEESIIGDDEEESIIDADDEDKESIIDDIASTFTSLLIKPTTMFSTPTKTPAKKMMLFIPSMTSPTPSTLDFAENATEEEVVMEDPIADLILDYRNQIGTKNCPCISKMSDKTAAELAARIKKIYGI
jgi:hypothetical protein